MKAISYVLFLLYAFNCFSQEVIIHTGFTVRDFIISENTLVYIEKRDIKNFNLISKANDTLIDPIGYFIGGYGLRVFYDKSSKQIITASNELIRDVGSIRFYDIIKKNINLYNVYYPTDLIDFYVSPNDSLFFLSKKDKQIEIFKYGGVPRYKKIDSLALKSYSRKLVYHKNNLYYITDQGEVFIYNILTQTKRLIYKCNDLLANFILDKSYKNLFVTSSDGKIVKIHLQGNLKPQSVNVSNAIIEAIDLVDDKYIITGDWNGVIKLMDIDRFKIVKQFNNKHRIVKILVKGNYFYTSSSDRTIKKWKID